MSGHSKWASIRHKKGAADAKRANIFTKLANTITVAAKQGGGDVNFNPSLRVAVEAGRKANMPKDKIDRAIKRGTGELGGAVVEELLYEGFGPGNVAMLVEVLTDNRNRASADVRNIIMKNGGRFPEGGGVAYQFTKQGVIRFEGVGEGFEEAAIESGADDYKLQDGFAVVYTSIGELHTVKAAIEAAGFVAIGAQIEHVPNIPIEISDEDLEKCAALIDLLDEYDDVTNVYTNLAE